MGLLDNLFSGDANQQGLLAGSMALLNASGPSRMPVGLGQAMGQGLMAGQQAYQGAQENALQKQLRELQMQSIRMKAEADQRTRTREEEMLNLAKQFAITPEAATARSMGPTMDGGVVPQVEPGFDYAGLANALAARGDYKAALEIKDKIKKEGEEWSQTPQYDEQGRAYVLSKTGQTKYLGGIKQREKVVADDVGDKKVFRTEYSTDPLGTIAKAQDPNSKASNALGWANYGLSKQRLANDSDGGGGGGGKAGLSADAIENAAARYNADGTLPTLGMGKDGNATRQAILNRAAELADGPPGRKLKPIPPAVNTAIITNKQAANQLDRAIALLEGNDIGDPTKGGMAGDKDATGLKGFLPPTVLNRVDPKGVSARAEIADVGSLKIHDRTGAAMTMGEFPRLVPFIPMGTDSGDTALKKLRRLKLEIGNETKSLGDTYSEEMGYIPSPVLKEPRQNGGGPQVGDIDGGYRFKGGNPKSRLNWEKVP